MARKVHTLEVNVEGEQQTFYYRKPSGAMMLKQSDRFKADKLTNEQASRDLLTECLVHEDGSPFNKDEVSAVLDLDWDVLQQLNAVLMPQPKKDESAKNA